MVIDGCKMPHNSSFDSMSHFVQDEFQSTNSGDSFKHIQCKSKTYTKHTLNTFLKTHRKHLQNIKSKQKHQKFKNHQTPIFNIYHVTEAAFSYLPTINVTFLIFSLWPTPLWLSPVKLVAEPDPFRCFTGGSASGQHNGVGHNEKMRNVTFMAGKWEEAASVT
jgi:hypothetical protein